MLLLLLLLGCSKIVSREIFCFAAERFCHPGSHIRDSPAAPRQKYVSGWVLDVPLKTDSDILQGGQKVQNLASIFDNSRL